MSILTVAILDMLLAAVLGAVLAAVVTRPLLVRRPARVAPLRSQERQLRRLQ
jgi:hypothetical protein